MAEEKEPKRASTKKVKVTFNKNVKFGKEIYKLGESIEVPEKDYTVLLEAGVIKVGD